MKILFFFLIILLTVSCSFDNKSGIWNDASKISTNNKEVKSIESNYSNKRYEDIFIKDKLFNEEVSLSKNINPDIDAPVKIDKWQEQYGDKTNNISNVLYRGNKTLLSKSSRLSKVFFNNNIIFYKNNLISSDHNGKIFIYSLSLKKKIFEYNFYKKKLKKFTKKLYLIADKDVLYIADNIGYLYAINLKNQTLIWAKNFGIPFRSNLKIIDEQILLASQDNVIYSVNKKTGENNWQFATSLTFLKSDFENNFVIDKDGQNIFFLNTSGELYAINNLNQRINWVINFKNSSLVGDVELFLSQPLVIKKNSIIISTENSILSYDLLDGTKNWSFPSGTILKPALTTNFTYIVTKNNLLICIDNKSGEVLWSTNAYKNLNQKKMKKKINIFYDLKIVNNEINLFSRNGYLLSFDYRDGAFNFIKKISKNGINSEIVFFKENMYLMNSKNRLLKFN
jgi:outer membrane protein assembly factor BamB